MSLDRAKLAKVLALLDSDQPGERVAAMEAAGRILQQGNARWADLALAGATATTQQLANAVRTAQAWQQRAEKHQAAERVALERIALLERENRALARRLTDAEARLQISQGENQKLRAAVGPEKAAAAALKDNGAVQAMRGQG
jgi:chromosome segregation ATPase